MADGHVDGGAPSDLSAGGRRVSERSEGCGVGVAGTADPASLARWTTAQDRHASGDERNCDEINRIIMGEFVCGIFKAEAVAYFQCV